MAEQLRNFDHLWNAYPAPGGPAEDAKHMIGGEVDADWVTNTCVVRLSRAMNYSGNLVAEVAGDEILTLRGADGRPYALRVAEFQRYLRRRYGPPTLSWTYPPQQGGPVPASFRGRKGILCFEVSVWSDATGHFDLWDGSAPRHHGYFDVADAVHLWEVPASPPERPLSASVGTRGANRHDDVVMVQDLLARAGKDPGPIDGDCGKRTRDAIKAFQARFLARPDGRVDPEGRTWHELLGH